MENKRNNKYECLKLENQLCFPLYACSNAIIRKYKPYLDELDLTYTQYITMMVLWDRKKVNVKELGDCLFLNSGTLTPLLKKLENKGYIERKRLKEDERNLMVSITEKGEELKERGKPKKAYNIGLWGISLKCKERLDKKKGTGMKYGVIITLKEMNGKNRINDFKNLYLSRGWLVTELDVKNQIDIYTKLEEEIELE